MRFVSVSYQAKQRIMLDHLSLEIPQGAITGVLGPNGAGKTTMLTLVMGLKRPSQGKVLVLGETLPASNALRQKIGAVMQETALYDELTTMENLRFAASLYHLRDSRQRIQDVLALLGLADRAQDVVRHLSGGLQRRVAIARALLHQPALLIIDEPTLGVDVDTRHTIWSHLRRLRASGTTVLVSTNYLDEALALCDHVAVLRKGKLLTFETPQALVARAGNCVEVECAPSVIAALQQTLQTVQGVGRIESMPYGLAIFLDGQLQPEHLIPVIAQTAPIRSVRVRAADLAEVFQAFAEVTG